MEQVMRNLPDSVFQDVKMEDLLDDEVYLKLAYDGWSSREIATIMSTAVKDKKKAKAKSGYGFYAKQWLPVYGRALGDDPMYMFTDTAMPSAMSLSIATTVSDDILNKTWPKIVYTPDDRKQGRRNSGYFRPVEHKPSSGRIHWIVVHPENPDSLYVVPDGAGIFKTGDCGKTWTCISDNIPERINRSQSTGYGIPVDPDDWNHVFAFMANSTVYETRDGGDTWRRIQGATHKGFKRGYCFRDAEGTLKFIGASMNSSNRMYNQLWISEDTCKTWTSVPVPDEYKESLPSGVRGFWFQEIAFDANDRNRIYLPGSRSLLYFDDGAKSSVVNGQKMYTLKQMSFDVYNQDKTVKRYPSDYPDNHALFPMPADGVGFLLVSPHDSDKMWFACGRREDNKTALYYSEDRGKTWITLHEPLNGIGGGSIFGNEMAYSWLGGFGVNFKDPDWIYGCSMSSAISSNGGRNFTEYLWINRIKSLQDDGRYYDVSNSRHNADNHCIASHKSGRIFRGSDGGLFVKDAEINGGEWTNIGSNMGQMLYYNVRVNEFGDQAIIGNTQDIDVQTYRYGRWGNWRGYEGTESSFNPYTSVEYFSGSGGSSLDGMSFDSWNTARNYADVVTGSWYMLRTWSASNPSTLYRIDDVGRSVIDLYKGLEAKAAEIGLARDKGRSTLFVRTTDYLYKYSTDGGNTFVPIMTSGQPTKFSNSHMAVDPDNSDFIYIGLNGGKVIRLNVNNGTNETVGSGLPSINCDRLIFHEGSGDLYFVHYESGIYILEKGSDIWRFWTKGYNGSKFGDVDLNYTTQEMVISDYGRGVWVADLEHPADRYFKNGFALKEYSHRNGRRTIGIDTRWTVPLYYYYHWTVNGETVNNPYQYLNRPLKAGDRVQLTLTLRESPDVKTVSAEYTVTGTESRSIEHRQGNALYSSGAGRVDIGYMDWFFNDFTIDMWGFPMSDGVLLANRQKDQNNGKGAKGFLLYLEDGKLKFTYSPMNVLAQPTYETAIEQNITVVGPAMATGKWTHVAVTQKRDGEIRLYLNGELATTATRLYPDHTLNNSVCLSLFGDAHEQNTLQGSVDELKIWNRELTLEELRREMFSVNLSGGEGLVAYYNFNGESLDTDEEAFTGYRPVSRTRAEVSARRMTLPVSADYAVSQTLSVGENRFSSGEKALLTLTTSSISNLPAVVFAYDASQWSDDEDNLDKRYYEPAAVGYMIRTFGALQESDLADISFHNASRPFADKNYRLYVADNTGDRSYWKFFGNLDSDAKTGALTLKQVPLQDIIDRKLLIVSMKPSIEVTVEGLTSDGRLMIYDENSRNYRMTARTVEGMAEPDGHFEIISDSSILRPPSSLYFANGTATGELKVDFDYLGSFNQTVKTCLRGPDDRMIPVSVDVVNRIAPSELGNAVAIPKGGLIVGNGADFAPLDNTNTLTIMGWVRIDNDFALRGTSPIFFFRSEYVHGTALG
ncbi:MAG: hypothetical protein J1E02_08635, partial [Coprobacter sp.]|nr:hypothetical protein [Coprobacter sp.]